MKQSQSILFDNLMSDAEIKSTKKLSDILTLSVFKKMLEPDPNMDLAQLETITDESLSLILRTIEGTELEKQLIEILDGRDLDKDPIPFVDFGIQKSN